LDFIPPPNAENRLLNGAFKRKIPGIYIQSQYSQGYGAIAPNARRRHCKNSVRMKFEIKNEERPERSQGLSKA